MKNLLCMFWFHKELYWYYEIVEYFDYNSDRLFRKKIRRARCCNCNEYINPKSRYVKDYINFLK